MSSKLATAFVAVLALSACAPRVARQGPPPLKPADGPSGTISVDHLAGGYARLIQARFRLDRAGGYVLVGHLGGDGVVRVLYPETPKSSGWVSGGRTKVLKPHPATFDAAPQRFSFATAPYRSVGARQDSYDGLGHGYVFMITSRYAIDYGAVVDGSGFDALEFLDYEHTSDPRFAIRALANELVTGPYTLKFAQNQSALATGCASPWGLTSFVNYGYHPWMDFGFSYFGNPGIALLNGIAFARHSGMESCRGAYYASNRLYPAHRSMVVTIPGTGTPQGPLTPRLQRPTRRIFENPERTAVIGGRSSIDRRGPLSTRSGIERSPGRAARPFDPRSSSTGDVYRGRSTWTPNDGTRAPDRAARPMDAPRLNTPAPPSQPPTTTTSTSTGGETRTERPKPQP